MTTVLAPVYSARDSAYTNRPASTSLLCIDSEDRFRDYTDARSVTAPLNRSPYNFTINKNQSLMNGFFTRLGVTEVVFPWVLPNINVSTASIICTVAGTAIPAAEFTLELDIGFYTPSMIAAALQTLVRNINPVTLGAFTMTYGVSDINFPVDNPTTTQLPIFQYRTNNAPAGITISFRPLTAADDPFFNNPLRKQLFDLLGFSDDNTTLEDRGYGAQTYCQFTRYVDIVCTQLTANQALKDTMSQIVARDVLARLYVNDAPGVQSTVLPSSATFCPPGCMPTTIYRDYVTPKQIQWIPNQPVPGYLKFEVYDDAGFALSDYDYVSYGNGANWSMSLLVSEN